MPEHNSDLDGEIDLRRLIHSLLRYKWWILGVTLAAAAIAFLANQLGVTKTYQAKALVVFGQPPLNVNVASPSSSNVNLTALALPDSKGITDLATVDDMLYGVYQSKDLAESRAHGLSFAEFKHGLVAVLSGTNQLWLQVTEADPQQAALVANLWADALASRLNALYGSSSAMVTALEQQANDRQQAWNAAEKTLVDYLSRSDVDALAVQLNQEEIAYSSELSRMQSIDLLLSDGRALNGRLSAQQPNAAVTAGDSLSLAMLQQRANDVLLCIPLVDTTPATNADSHQAFTCSPSQEIMPGVQLQISGSDLSAGQSTVADAQQGLKFFMDSLKTQQEELKNGLAQKTKQLSDIRTQSESAQFQVNQLTAQRDLAAAAYTAVSGQLSNTQIEVAASSQVARVAGKASPPSAPVARRGTVNVVLGGALGLILSVFAVLALTWWQQFDHAN